MQTTRWIATLLLCTAALYVIPAFAGAGTAQAWWCPGHSGGSFYCTGK